MSAAGERFCKNIIMLGKYLYASFLAAGGVYDSIAKSLVDHGPTTRRPLRMDADSVALPLSLLKL
jgi:hypothetical protein